LFRHALFYREYMSGATPFRGALSVILNAAPSRLFSYSRPARAGRETLNPNAGARI